MVRDKNKLAHALASSENEYRSPEDRLRASAGFLLAIKPGCVADFVDESGVYTAITNEHAPAISAKSCNVGTWKIDSEKIKATLCMYPSSDTEYHTEVTVREVVIPGSSNVDGEGPAYHLPDDRETMIVAEVVSAGELLWNTYRIEDQKPGY